LLPRVRRPAGGYAAPTHYSSITLVETWEGLAGQFDNIESINYQLRKVTKNRGHFPTEKAAE
jgi:hypothetical protein